MIQQKTAPDIERFKSLLKSKGMKATPQRLAIHEAMLGLGHACADMVSEWISTHSPVKVTVASVYNTLTQLAELGIYSHRYSADSKMYFDVNTFKHLHLYDIRNNEFKDIIDDELIDMVESHFKKRRFRGYKIEGFDIQVICRPTKKARD